jgi:hypothetical protein
VWGIEGKKETENTLGIYTVQCTVYNVYIGLTKDTKNKGNLG